MKINYRRNSLLPLAAALALLVNHSTAATFTWDGDTSQFWNNAGNWVEGALVSANTTDIIISGTANVGLMLPGAVSYTIKSLTFDATNDADTRFSMTSTANVNQSARNLTFSSDSGNATLTVESGSTGNKTIDRIGTVNPATIILTSSLDVIHNGSGTLTLGNAVNAIVGGAGGINKSGTGTLILPGANTYSGATTITAGTLQLGKVLSLVAANWTAAKVNVKSGATLALNVGGADEFTATDVNNLLSPISVANSATEGLQSGAILGFNTTNASGGSFTQGNAIADSTGSGSFHGAIGLTKLGTGTLILDKTNTYTGTTTVSAGTLALGHATDTLSSSSAVTVDGATAVLSIAGNSDTVGAVSLKNGGSITGSGGTLTGASYAVESGSVFAILGGAVALTKSTAGTVTLSGANTYGGLTTVNQGTLSITHNNALGDNAGATTISPTISGNAQLALNSATADLAVAENINFISTSTLRARLENTSAFNHTLSGSINVDSSAASAVTEFNAETAGSITISGNITGSVGTGSSFLIRGDTAGVGGVITGNITLTGGGLTKTGTGTWTIGASGKTYSAPIISANQGILKIGADNYLASSPTLSMGNTFNNFGTFDLNGFSQKLGGITNIGTGGQTITSSAGTPVLTVDNPSNYSPTKTTLTGSLGLTKTGLGTLTLTVANTYTGDTIVNGGILQGNASNSFGAANNTRTITVNTGGTLNFNVAGLYGGHSSTSVPTLVINAGGTASNTITNGNNPLNNLTLNGGVLTSTSGQSSWGAWNINGTVTATGNSTITNSGGANQETMLASGTGATNTTMDVVNAGDLLTITTSLLNGRDTASPYNALVTGLTKTGTGTLLLTGTNAYTGATTITTGTLQLDGSTHASSTVGIGTAGILSGSGTVNGNATLTGGGIINKSAGSIAGTLAVTGGNWNGAGTVTGAVTSSSGTFTIGSGANLTASTGVSATGGALVVNGTLTGTLSADSSTTVSGTGTITENTTISGIHSPGNSPGIQSYGSNLSYTTGSSVTWELVADTLGLRGTDFDGINVGGILDFSGATSINLVFNFASSSVDWTDTFWDSSRTGTSGWLVYDVAGATTSFSNLSVTAANWLDGSGGQFNTSNSGNTFSLYQDGNDIYLNYTVIPEPNVAALLGGLGTLALLRRRRA